MANYIKGEALVVLPDPMEEGHKVETHMTVGINLDQVKYHMYSEDYIAFVMIGEDESNPLNCRNTAELRNALQAATNLKLEA